MMPQSQSRNEFLKSTMANLAFIDEAFQSKKRVYDVTQLVNSFLMTFSALGRTREGLASIAAGWSGVAWPSKISPPNQQARECVERYAMRMAHGNLVCQEGQSGEIAALHLWTCKDGKMVDWHATISVKDMRKYPSIALSNWQNKRSPAANG